MIGRSLARVFFSILFLLSMGESLALLTETSTQVPESMELRA